MDKFDKNWQASFKDFSSPLLASDASAEAEAFGIYVEAGQTDPRLKRDYTVQVKEDGMRLFTLFQRDGVFTKLSAYSKSGRVVKLSCLDFSGPVPAAAGQENKVMLDGELYVEGGDFSDVKSVVSGTYKGATNKIKYCVFDVKILKWTEVLWDVLGKSPRCEWKECAMTYEKRLQLLRDIGLHHNPYDQIHLPVETEVGATVCPVRNRPTEGVIVRRLDSNVNSGRDLHYTSRLYDSGTCVKVKPKPTIDAEIVDVYPWKLNESGVGSLAIRYLSPSTGKLTVSHVGTGFTHKMREDMGLLPLKGRTAEIAYSGCTEGGVIRCASFIKLKEEE